MPDRIQLAFSIATLQPHVTLGPLMKQAIAIVGERDDAGREVVYRFRLLGHGWIKQPSRIGDSQGRRIEPVMILEVVHRRDRLLPSPFGEAGRTQMKPRQRQTLQGRRERQATKPCGDDQCQPGQQNSLPVASSPDGGDELGRSHGRELMRGQFCQASLPCIGVPGGDAAARTIRPTSRAVGVLADARITRVVPARANADRPKAEPSQIWRKLDDLRPPIARTLRHPRPGLYIQPRRKAAILLGKGELLVHFFYLVLYRNRMGSSFSCPQFCPPTVNSRELRAEVPRSPERGRRHPSLPPRSGDRGCIMGHLATVRRQFW